MPGEVSLALQLVGFLLAAFDVWLPGLSFSVSKRLDNALGRLARKPEERTVRLRDLQSPEERRSEFRSLLRNAWILIPAGGYFFRNQFGRLPDLPEAVLSSIFLGLLVFGGVLSLVLAVVAIHLLARLLARFTQAAGRGSSYAGVGLILAFVGLAIELTG